jgi:phosphoribosylglycinamide formyltransferase 1
MKRIAVLVSGRGSNLQALIDAEGRGELGGTVVLAVTNVPGAPALDRARLAGIETALLDHRGRPREQYDQELAELLRGHRIDLVCLAGFMRILSPVFIRAFSGRILNIHPSLLPAFPGKNAQRQALEHGVRLSGATVHLVDEGLDSGPILLQEAVTVRDDDTADTLASRILETEHRIYPRAVRLLCEGHLRLDGRRAIVEVP